MAAFGQLQTISLAIQFAGKRPLVNQRGRDCVSQRRKPRSFSGVGPCGLRGTADPVVRYEW